MRRTVFALLAVAGVVLAGGAALVMDLMQLLRTGNPHVDALRLPVIYGVIRAMRPLSPAELARAVDVMRALLVLAATERSFNGGVGDANPHLAPGGPSISPWQIERVNAIKLGFWAPPAGVAPDSLAAREAYAGVDTQGLELYEWAWHAAEFFLREDMPPAGNDMALAFRVHNGGPHSVGPNPNPAAVDYGNRAVALAASFGWDLA